MFLMFFAFYVLFIIAFSANIPFVNDLYNNNHFVKLYQFFLHFIVSK